MPTNFKDSFLPTLHFNTKRDCDKHTTWSAHFPEGCAREVVRCLELLAKNNPDRWVYVTVPGLVKMCDGRFRKGKAKKAYSATAIEKALRFLRDKHVISRKHGTAPDGRLQEGFVVAPHGAMCRRYDRACVFVGVERATGTFILRPGDARWVRDETLDTGDSVGLVQFRDGVDQGLTKGDEGAVEGLDKGGARDGIGYGARDGVPEPEVLETVNDIEKAPVSLPPAITPVLEANPLNPPNPRNPHNPQNLPKQPKPDGDGTGKSKTGVCVLSEKESAMDLDGEVGKLVKGFVQHNDGEPGQISSKQREQLRELLKRHGRETFRGAALVWLKDNPWNSQTTHPFVSFINGFEGYAAKIAYDKKRAEQKSREAADGDSTTRFWAQKFRIGHNEKSLDPSGRYLASLPQEDRDYITKVAAANTLADMPPDNGKNYTWEEIEFRKRERDEAAAQFAKDAENFLEKP